MILHGPKSAGRNAFGYDILQGAAYLCLPFLSPFSSTRAKIRSRVWQKWKADHRVASESGLASPEIADYPAQPWPPKDAARIPLPTMASLGHIHIGLTLHLEILHLHPTELTCLIWVRVEGTVGHQKNSEGSR